MTERKTHSYALRWMVFALFALTITACDKPAQKDAPKSSAPAATAEKTVVRLGYFPNVTHAPAIVGVANGDFAKALGPDVELKSTTFNAGPSVIEAIFANQLDIAYIGPSPTINGFIKSEGAEVRVIAGAVENGTLIVGSKKRNITKLSQLKGAKVATPQLGNTQDISARAYITTTLGGKLGTNPGETEIIPIANPDIEILFQKDQIDAAWVPEPWGSRMVEGGLVTVIEEEKNLWPEKHFLLTNVIVREKFLEQHPDLVTKFLEAHVSVVNQLKADRQKFAAVINSETKRLTGKDLPPAVIEASLKHVEFITDPGSESFEAFFTKGHDLGFLKADTLDLDKLIDHKFLDEVKEEAGEVMSVDATKMVPRLPAPAPAPRDKRAIVLRVSFIVLLLVIWEVVAAMKVLPAYVFPSPGKVFQTFVEKVQYDFYLFKKATGLPVATDLPEEPSLTLSIVKSLGRMAVGYGSSVIGGLIIGVLLARSWLLKQTLGSLILSLQSLPSICWLPFALIWFGLDDAAILAVVILGAMFSIAIGTEGAIRNIPPIYIKVGRTLGAHRFTLAKDILLFAALPELVGALKMGWTFAWRSLMAAELIRGNIVGVGQLLENGRQNSDMPLMFLAVFTILAIGITVDEFVFGRIERAIRRRWGLEK